MHYVIFNTNYYVILIYDIRVGSSLYEGFHAMPFVSTFSILTIVCIVYTVNIGK